MSQPRQYFAQLIGTREGWPEQMTPDEEKVMSEHYRYLEDLTRKKKVYLAGPVFDPVFGLIILSVESEKEARAIMENEPSVTAGVHKYKMHEMRVSLLIDYRSPRRYSADPADRIVRKEVTVTATLDRVWDTWTTTEGVKSFFSSDAEVELRVGGPYEIYFLTDKPYGQRGSEDCKILSYLPGEMLSFEWNAPPDFGQLRDIRTHVVLQFEEIGRNRIRVTLSHIGWGRGEEWGRLYDYFDKAWERVLSSFKKRFEDEPDDRSQN